jgi:hypothetical protein
VEDPGTALIRLADRWRQCTEPDQAKLWRGLVHPSSRWLAGACLEAIHHHRDDSISVWLDPGGLLSEPSFVAWADHGQVLDAIRAHLMCVELACDPEHWTQSGRIDDEALGILAARTRLPRPLLRDIALDLCGLPPLQGARKEMTSVLLIRLAGNESSPGDGEGFTANLTFEAIEPGTHQPYPSARMSLLDFRDDFQQAVNVGLDYASGRYGWPGSQANVRWELTTREGDTPLPIRIGGPSASAAFGALLLALVSSR